MNLNSSNNCSRNCTVYGDLAPVNLPPDKLGLSPHKRLEPVGSLGDKLENVDKRESLRDFFIDSEHRLY